MEEAPRNLATTRSREAFDADWPTDESVGDGAASIDSSLDARRTAVPNRVSMLDPSRCVLDGRYQLEESLGSGGMGAVYKARHLLLKSTHAIKIIFSDLVASDPTLVARFRQEAVATAAIRHPNVVAVTDFGVHGGDLPFLVMDYIHGRTLQSYLERKGRLYPVEAVEIMEAVCAGVAAAHRLGIVHRDLKPLNIMLEREQLARESVKVLDFGLAKIKSGELLGSLAQAHSSGFMGSPFYMAPEQWSDDVPNARADVYSLGIIFYQMLTGDVPFKGPSIPAIMKKHLFSPPPAMTLPDGHADPPVEAVVRRALAKHPDDRFDSVEDFLEQLRRAIYQGEVTRTFPPVRRARIDGGAKDHSDQRTLSMPAFRNSGREFEGSHTPQHNSKKTRAALAEASLIPVDSLRGRPPRRKILEAKLRPIRFTTGLLCAALLLSAGVTTWLLGLRSAFKESPSQISGVAASAERLTPAPAPVSIGVPEAEHAGSSPPPHMAYIPSGVFMMGRDAAPGSPASSGNEWPAHEVVIDHFMMDKTEVTNEEYAVFVRETNYEPPSNWVEGGPPTGEEQWPVTGVTAEDAVAFAAWRSGRDGLSYRLPTEAEWEYAARNCSAELLYPWGTDWARNAANVGTSALKPVGSLPAGASHRGVLDLIGNAWEWTATEASFYAGNNREFPKRERGWVVVRGGSFRTTASSVTSATRGWVPAATKDSTLGFRLVAPAF